jgi:hypothetical protein
MIKDYGSLPAALEAAYPTHNWLEWMFPAVRDNYWDSFDNQIKFFDWLYDKLQFKTKADWYSVTVASIDQAGGPWENFTLQRVPDNSYTTISSIFIICENRARNFEQTCRKLGECFASNLSDTSLGRIQICQAA